jgi:hypothetical protein
MAGESVRVDPRSYRDTVRGFRDMDKDVAKGLRKQLRESGQLVQRTAAQLFEPVSPHTAGGYKVRVRQRGVAVEQSLRRTTGQHPEFGALQMRTALLPALDRNEPEVVAGINNVLDRAARHNNFD